MISTFDIFIQIEANVNISIYIGLLLSLTCRWNGFVEKGTGAGEIPGEVQLLSNVL